MVEGKTSYDEWLEPEYEPAVIDPHIEWRQHPAESEELLYANSARLQTTFNNLAGIDADDLAIGKLIQAAYEYGLKSLIKSLGLTYDTTHQTGQLIGTLRRGNPEMANFTPSIPNDVLNQYQGKASYQPIINPVTDRPDYLESANRDLDYILLKAEAAILQKHQPEP